MSGKGDRHRAGDRRAASERLRAPGILLGLGLGGFIDGIVFHQVLQWHHLLSNTDGNAVATVRGLENNTFADGLFHVATWVLAVIGLVVLWRVVHRSDVRDLGRSLFGWALAGWGIFNTVEGIVNHHILQIHHVRDDVTSPGPWDLGFLALGALLLTIGVALARSRRGAAAT